MPTGPKTESADRDLALTADFLLFEAVLFFFRERFATPVNL
jgi:hypothetical protein